MGTHESAPSRLSKGDKKTLKEHLKGQDLPFLFKVLSVQKALSIQAHPDLLLAPKLHLRDPKNYRDSNHKPEMAIALGCFEALCGFRRAVTIGDFAEKYRGFGELIGGDEMIQKLCNANFSDEKNVLKESFTKLMNRTSDEISEALKLMPELSSDPSNEELKLFYRLNAQYPSDIGIFCVFFLNHFTLQDGQAVFLAANEPHAYLSGSCIECMATSDNVVRAGLTPKHRDVQVLCSMLTYNSFNGLSDLLLDALPLKDRPFVRLYKSPVEEFSVLSIKLAPSAKDHHGDAPIGRSLLLCIEGSALLKAGNSSCISVKKGSVIYLPEKCEYSLLNESNDSECVLYQAFEPLSEKFIK